MEPVQIAIVGLGGWGRNHVRTMTGLSECRVRYIFDLSAKAVETQLRLYPNLQAAKSYEEILADDAVQAVIIATSAPTHYELARQALEAGKDIFVEKPMTLHMEESRNLCQLAEEKKRLIQVGHLLLFHPAVQYLKELIASGDLGDIYYIYCQRLNLGIVRSDENSLWSLAPHDISLCNYLLGGHPEQIKATGGCYLQKGIEDVIFVTMGYPGGRIAHVHVSWLDPHKTRRLTIVGSKKMVVFDDMETTEKVRIYDKGVSRLDYENFGESLSIRTGNILIPSVPNQEPLKLQAQHFIDCVRQRRQPLVDGREGLSVVEALNRASEELAETP